MISPTVSRRRLGAALREMRNAAGLTHAQVAERLMCSPAKISHIERGRYKINPRDVRDLVQIYGARGDQAASLMALAHEQATTVGWWQKYGDVHRPHFTTFLGLEAAASSMSVYEPLIVPGLLQTADYARAVIRGTFGRTADTAIERMIEARLIRQQRLVGSAPLVLWVAVEESVLYRPVGGRSVQRAQLAHLLDVSDRQNVTLQVLPTSVGVHPGVSGQFAMLEFPDPADPAAVYVDVPAGEPLIGPEEVETYAQVRRRLRQIALSADESRDAVLEARRTL